ncbi:MAG: hypothetical protein HGA96_07245 [Desulfobulbaceae bacterium]|nr:hypothetical protein [Desulfobulbaceae bacterium]
MRQRKHDQQDQVKWLAGKTRYYGLVIALGLGLLAGVAPTWAVTLGGAADDGAAGASTANTALGYTAIATGTATTAVGGFSAATGFQATAVGNVSLAAGANSTAVGRYSEADGVGATSVGDDSWAYTDGATAIGRSSYVVATDGAALGESSFVNFGATGGVALGQGATVNAHVTGAVALGQGSVASAANTVSVGTSAATRRIVNVSNGTANSDAATVGQMNTSIAGEASLRAAADSAQLERLDKAEGRIIANIAAIDAETTARFDADTTLENQITSEASARAAADAALQATIDARVSDVTNLQTALGTEENSRSAADATLQANLSNEASGRAAADALLQADLDASAADLRVLQAAGRGLSWTGDAANLGASASGIGSTALGSGASAHSRDTAVGYHAQVSADGSVAVGANSTVAATNSVAVGADSMVAANAAGGTALGQNARVAGGASGSVALGQNAVASEANTVSLGTSGSERRLTNLAAGINATDGANLGQLRQVEGNLLVSIGDLQNRLNIVENRVDDIGALSSAFSALVPNARATGNTQISLGVGNYGHANALAGGMFHYVNNNLLLNAGISTSFGTRETAGRAGITFGW